MLAIASRQKYLYFCCQWMPFDKAFWLHRLHLSIYLPLTMALHFLTVYQTFQNQPLDVEFDACCAEHGRQHDFFLLRITKCVYQWSTCVCVCVCVHCRCLCA